ncbi:MAG: DUF1700 domain-containing protein [Angelakisella sp.]
MTKTEFCNILGYRLRHLPQAEVEKSLTFYKESIDDRMEDGMSEEQAVASLGEIEQIAQGIELELPFATLVKSSIQANKQRASNKTLWVVLAICGSPLWLPVALAFALVVLVLWLTVWILILAFYAVLLAFAVAGSVGLLGGVFQCFVTGPVAGLMIMGMALGCAGLAVLCLAPVNWLCKKLAHVSVLLLKKTKGLFVQKGEAV